MASQNPKLNYASNQICPNWKNVSQLKLNFKNKIVDNLIIKTIKKLLLPTNKTDQTINGFIIQINI